MGYATPKHKVVLNIEKREKIDLVQDCRPRYVDPVLLPSVKELTLVEKMSKVSKMVYTCSELLCVLNCFLYFSKVICLFFLPFFLYAPIGGGLKTETGAAATPGAGNAAQHRRGARANGTRCWRPQSIRRPARRQSPSKCCRLHHR